MKRGIYASDGAGRSADIVARLEALRQELVGECEQYNTDLRAAVDSEEAEEGAYSCAVDIMRHLVVEIRAVEAALERIRAGKYGLCVDCGAPIPASRLRAMPTARRCMGCQVGAERRAG